MQKTNKQTKFPPYSTRTSDDVICIIFTRVYHCWGLPASFEGYFVLSAAFSLVTKMTVHISQSLLWGCVDRYTFRHTREYQLYFINHPHSKSIHLSMT